MSGYQLRMIREKLETVSGTDAAPGPEDAVLCRNLTMRPLEGDWQEQDFATGREGAQPEDIYNLHAAVEYEVEATPSGAAGTPPRVRRQLISSGLSETVVTGASVGYSPTPAGEAIPSTTLQMRNGLIQQNVVGCRGSFGFTAEVRRRAFFSFNRRGRYGAPANHVAAAHDFTSWGRSLECTPENMQAFTLGGTRLCVRSFSLTDGRQPQVDKYMNCGGTDLGDRRFSGRMQVKWPTLAAKDILGLTRTGTTQALVFELGTTAGSRLRIAAPRVQMKFAGEENIDGDLGASIDLVFLPDQGDDDILIEFL
ncbi:phage tail tube protein [Paracoccus sanguinis]|uniref:phage tail tube protein n=1 Tax=Paracoccus sanguinis TaxID=1545044 RepID=UPI00051FC078|nr:phage tail tube protein [Paracoccus sanguinis]KGJ21051.1 hypothetical protein IX55_03800 [Paracoccus sanguinis]